MIPVEVPCSCPGKPHEQDTVFLAPVADVRIGMGVMSAMNNAPASVPDMEAAISAVLIHVGPRAWTFTHLVRNEKTGKEEEEPLPLTPENIDERLIWTQGGAEVAERANELYAGDVFAPLARKKSKGSKRGQTRDSISATRTRGSRTPSSAKPSLRTVTDGPPSEAKAS